MEHKKILWTGVILLLVGSMFLFFIGYEETDDYITGDATRSLCVEHLDGKHFKKDGYVVHRYSNEKKRAGKVYTDDCGLEYYCNNGKVMAQRYSCMGRCVSDTLTIGRRLYLVRHCAEDATIIAYTDPYIVAGR